MYKGRKSGGVVKKREREELWIMKMNLGSSGLCSVNLKNQHWLGFRWELEQQIEQFTASWVGELQRMKNEICLSNFSICLNKRKKGRRKGSEKKEQKGKEEESGVNRKLDWRNY
jgi:hypothetical protein